MLSGPMCANRARESRIFSANRFTLRKKILCFFCESTSQKMDSSKERTRITRISMRIGEKTKFARIWPSASKIFRLAPKYHTKGCSHSSADSPGARTLVFVASERFHSSEFRASIARTPFCAILWRSPKYLLLSEGLKKAVAVSKEKIQQRSRRRGQFSSSRFPCRKVPKSWQG